MKKILRKPENWQDFENLCKKLFGEMWSCPNTVKKNGRLGQSQAGVDVYGRPKNEDDYWGVQCKGKDDYVNSQITTKEIDEEIAKALTFKPSLKVFCFATTSNKDVKVEEYIRLKDRESRKAGKFEIILYCWEDLVDLIEEHRNTFNWYVNSQQYRENFDFEVWVDGEKEKIIKPTYTKTIKKYNLLPPIDSLNSIEQLIRNHKKNNRLIIPNLGYISALPFQSTHINHCWCKFSIWFKNTGNLVIEDWKFLLYFEKDKWRKIDDDFDDSNLLIYKGIRHLRRTFVYEDKGIVLYRPLNNEALIQKDSKSFGAFVIPKFGADFITLKWEILARDFNKKGTLKLIIEPIIEEKIITVDVENEEDLLPDEVTIEEKKVRK